MKRWAKRAGMAAGALTLALLAAVCALFIWLGTESARRTALDMAGKALAAQGLYLEAEKTGGRLPFGLRLEGVSLSDASGEWFSLEAAELEFNPWWLFGLVVQVDKLHLDGVVLSRLPVLPSGPPDEAGKSASGGGLPSLPVDIRLDDFRLDGLLVKSGLLGALVPEKAAELARLGPLRLDAESAAAIQRGVIMEPGHIRLKLNASLSLGSSAASLELFAGPGNGFTDRLLLELTLHEDADGLAAIFAGVRQLPPYDIAVSSDSSLSDIRLEFKLEAHDLASLSGSLGLRALGNGSGWQDSLERLASPNWEADAAFRAVPGPLLRRQGGPFQLPELVLELIGSELDLSFKARSNARASSAQIAIDSLRLENALALVGVEKASLDLAAAGLDFSGDILAEVKGERFFAVVGAASDGIPMFGKSSLRLSSRAALSLPDNGPVAEFGLKGRLSTQSRHSIFSGPDIGVLSAGLETAGRYDGRLTLDSLRVNGLGLDVDGRAELDFAPLVIALEADVNAARGGDWDNILRHLSAGVPELGFRASLKAGLDLRPESAARELTATVRLAASDYVWPAGILEKVFGPYAAVQADFSGPLLSPYNMTLYGLATGFEAVEAKAYGADELVPGHESARALGWLELSLPDAEPLKLMPRWSRKQQINMLTLNGQVDAVMNNVGLFLPDGGGFAGPARGSASIQAVIDGDDTLLDLRAALSTCDGQPVLSPLGEISLSSKAQVDLTLRGGLNMLGKAEIRADTSKAGPVMLDTGWQVAWPDGSDLKLALGGLKASFAEMAVEGDVAASFPDRAGARPRLEGRLKAGFDNWKALNAIFTRLDLGIPPLSGAHTDLNISMSTERGVQTAEVRFDLPRLHMLLDAGDNAAILPAPGEKQPPLGTPGMMLLNGIHGQVDVNDLWGKRRISAHLKTDSGSIDAETWQSSAVYLDLAGNVGRVNMSIRNDGKALEQAQAVEEGVSPFTSELVERYLAGEFSGSAGAGQAEGAGLKGDAGLDELEMASVEMVFRVSPPAFSVHQAAMFSPELQSGFYLRKPVLINLEKGLYIDKLDLAVLPAGHVRGNAYFSAERSSAKTDIKDLPLALVRKLTGIPLPDGEFSLEGNMRSQAGKISGQSEIFAVLRQAGVPAERAMPLTLRLDTMYGQGSGRYRAEAPGHVRFSGAGSLEAEGAAAGQELQVEFDIPLRTAERGFLVLDTGSPLSASLSWNGEISPLWRLLPVADRHLEGLARFDARLGGSFSRLEYQAEAFLAGSRYEDSVFGFMLAGVDLEARAGKGGGRITLSGGDGNGGRLALDAQISGDGAFSTGLGGGAASPLPEITVRGQVNHLVPLHRDDLAVMLSGTVDASGPLLSPVLKGDFVVEQGNLNLLASLGGGITTLPVEERSEFAAQQTRDEGPFLEISVEAPGRFYVRGAGLDSEWRGSATVNGPASNPSFSAEISPVRGYFELLSRPFALSKGQISVWGGRDYLDSDLDLLLTYSSASLTAEINVGGSLRRPVLTLGSRPELPQDQILSQVIFGKDITQLTALEALQVANGVRQIVSFGRGGVDVMGEMRELLGVDTLRIGSTSTGTHSGSISGSPDASAFGVGSGRTDSAASSPTLEAGKYINDSIYVGVEQGAVENSTRVRVEVELKPNLTLQGSSGAQSSQIGLGWKRDY